MQHIYLGQDIRFLVELNDNYPVPYVSIELWQPNGELLVNTDGSTRTLVERFTTAGGNTIDNFLWQVRGVYPQMVGTHHYLLHVYTDQLHPDDSEVHDALKSPRFGDIEVTYGMLQNDYAHDETFERVLDQFVQTTLRLTKKRGEGCPRNGRVSNVNASGIIYTMIARNERGEIVDETVTDTNGNYTLNLPAGVYLLERHNPNGQVVTKKIVQNCISGGGP
jgi:hypothetical protein